MKTERWAGVWLWNCGIYDEAAGGERPGPGEERREESEDRAVVTSPQLQLTWDR